MALQKKEKQKLIWLVIVAIISGIFLYQTFNADPPSPPETSLPITSNPTTEETPSVRPTPQRSSGRSNTARTSSPVLASITASTFEQHNTINDCWVLIEGEVYDITLFGENFPEQKEEINQYCGTFGFEAGFLGENSQLKEKIIDNATKIGVIN